MVSANVTKPISYNHHNLTITNPCSNQDKRQSLVSLQKTLHAIGGLLIRYGLQLKRGHSLQRADLRGILVLSRLIDKLNKMPIESSKDRRKKTLKKTIRNVYSDMLKKANPSSVPRRYKTFVANNDIMVFKARKLNNT